MSEQEAQEREVESVDPEPATPTPDAPKHVNLVSVIVDEFGISEVEARRMLLQSRVVIGEGDSASELAARTINVPLDQINGKTVTVEGEVKTIRFVYKADEA